MLLSAGREAISPDDWFLRVSRFQRAPAYTSACFGELQRPFLSVPRRRGGLGATDRVGEQPCPGRGAGARCPGRGAAGARDGDLRGFLALRRPREERSLCPERGIEKGVRPRTLLNSSREAPWDAHSSLRRHFSGCQLGHNK